MRPTNRPLDELDETLDDDIDAAQILGVSSEPKRVKEGRERFHYSGRNKYRKHNTDSPPPAAPTPFDDIANMMDSSAKHTRLTYRQRKAIRCLTAFNYSVEETAAEIGVTPSTIYVWMRRPIFSKMLFITEKYISLNAMDTRLKYNLEIIEHLYEELLLRCHRGDLQSIPLHDLVDMIGAFAKESRLDDRTAATHRIETTSTSINIELIAIQERFNLRRVRRELMDSKIGNTPQALPSADIPIIEVVADDIKQSVAASRR
jgi:predicted DNA-binding protein YlxM (UPF0122 family)